MTNATNGGDAGPVQDQTPGPDENEPRTPAPDTNPPEDQDPDKAPSDPVQNGSVSDEAEKPKRKSTRKKNEHYEHISHGWSYTDPEPTILTRIQRALGRNGFYEGAADGDWALKSKQGVQRVLAKYEGFAGAINGHIGENQAEAIQLFAREHGNYAGPVNKVLDHATWAGFAVGLEHLDA